MARADTSLRVLHLFDMVDASPKQKMDMALKFNIRRPFKETADLIQYFRDFFRLDQNERTLTMGQSASASVLSLSHVAQLIDLVQGDGSPVQARLLRQGIETGAQQSSSAKILVKHYFPFVKATLDGLKRKDIVLSACPLLEEIVRDVIEAFAEKCMGVVGSGDIRKLVEKHIGMDLQGVLGEDLESALNRWDAEDDDMAQEAEKRKASDQPVDGDAAPKRSRTDGPT